MQETLQALRADTDRFEQFCSEQLDLLEERRGELAAREQQVKQQQASENAVLASAQAEAAELRAQLAADRQAAAQAMSQALAQAAAQAATDAAVQADTYEQQIRQLQQVVESLESELEASRRCTVDQRAEWMAELLCTAMERQTAEAAAAIAAANSLELPEGELKLHRSGRGADAVSAKADPVLNAVMQQFESLQKGRNPAGKKPGRQGVA